MKTQQKRPTPARAGTRTLSAQEWKAMLLALRLARQHLETLIETASTDDQVAPDDPSAVEVSIWRRQLARLCWLQTQITQAVAGEHAGPIESGAPLVRAR